MRRLKFLLALVFLLSLWACRSKSHDASSSAVPSESHGTSPLPVYVVVKRMEPRLESDLGGRSFNEVLVTLDIGNRGSDTIRFDRVRAVFYGDQKPIASLTCIMAKDGRLHVSYPPEGGGTPPDVESQGTFEIPPGDAGTFPLESANSNFGSLSPSIQRKLVVTLLSGTKVAYGPFDINLSRK